MLWAPITVGISAIFKSLNFEFADQGRWWRNGAWCEMLESINRCAFHVTARVLITKSLEIYLLHFFSLNPAKRWHRLDCNPRQFLPLSIQTCHIAFYFCGVYCNNWFWLFCLTVYMFPEKYLFGFIARGGLLLGEECHNWHQEHQTWTQS